MSVCCHICGRYWCSHLEQQLLVEKLKMCEATSPLLSSAAAFVTKDSGARTDLANGMVRDVADDKPDWTLLLDGPMLGRWNELLGRGAKKYGKRNWTKAISAPPGEARDATKARFLESAFRHFMQWARGETDEDHAAAVFFNINGYEAMRDSK